MLGNLLDLAGGLLSDRSARKDAQRNRRLSKQQFAEQMDTSVQRRVADARKAGIHPLFAMGASVGASPTISAGGRQPTGSGVGDAISRLVERLSRKADRGTNAAAARDEAEAALLNSRTKKMEQELTSRGHDGASVKTFPLGTNPGPEIVYGPAEFFNPEVPTSKAPGIKSGTLPGVVDVVLPDKRKIQVYASELEADEIKQVDILYQRAVHKGTDAMMAVRKWFKSKGYVLAPYRKSSATRNMKEIRVKRRARKYHPDNYQQRKWLQHKKTSERRYRY